MRKIKTHLPIDLPTPGVEGYRAATPWQATTPAFTKDQSMICQDACRPKGFKFLNKKAPTSKDYLQIDANADLAAHFVQDVYDLVPKTSGRRSSKSLTRPLVGGVETSVFMGREVDKLSFRKPNQLALYIKPHAEEQKKEVKMMLDKEVCGPDAELYLRLSSTCPLYYMRWTQEIEEANIEFVSKVPQTGGRAEILGPFTQADGKPFTTPVTGRVCRPRSKIDPRSPFSVLPGLVVVRSQGFEVHDSESDSSPTTGRKRTKP
ncbi:unnamed protein product [Ectocarpus sp. CCAP 1310/34]|nr:unnamed protein product [Ectocarpus sp. CCAP 1310/34]